VLKPQQINSQSLN